MAISSTVRGTFIKSSIFLSDLLIINLLLLLTKLQLLKKASSYTSDAAAELTALLCSHRFEKSISYGGCEIDD